MGNANEALQGDDGEMDLVMLTILRQLWEASQESSAHPWSLAKLSKRTCIPMSTLRRSLTQCEAAGIVDVTTAEDGRSFAALNATGIEIFPALFNTQ